MSKALGIRPSPAFVAGEARTTGAGAPLPGTYNKQSYCSLDLGKGTGRALESRLRAATRKLQKPVAPVFFWPGNLVRRLREPWARDAVRKWEEQEVADIADILGAGREGHRAGSLRLDRTSDVPAKLDTRAVFATMTQRVVRKDVKLERHNIEDFLHTCARHRVRTLEAARPPGQGRLAKVDGGNRLAAE